MSVPLNLSGFRVGRLTVEQCLRKEDQRGFVWRARCDCGAVVEKSAGNFVHLKKQGRRVSCGCWKKEMAGALNRTHGLRDDPLYKIWRGMKSRCNNPQTDSFKNYGGRGIKLCERWNNSFAEFFNDMSSNYRAGLLIERLDNDGDYDPINCVWETRATQALNKRSNVLIDTPKGQMTIKEAAKLWGLSYTCLHKRITYKGWPVEKALTWPLRYKDENVSRKHPRICGGLDDGL